MIVIELHVLHERLACTLIIRHLDWSCPFIFTMTCPVIFSAARVESLGNTSEPPTTWIIWWRSDSSTCRTWWFWVHWKIEFVYNGSIINKVILDCIKSHLVLLCSWRLIHNIIHRAWWLRVLLVRRIVNSLLLIAILLILLLLWAGLARRQEKTLVVLTTTSGIVGCHIFCSLLIAKLLLLLVWI